MNSRLWVWFRSLQSEVLYSNTFDAINLLGEEFVGGVRSVL